MRALQAIAAAEAAAAAPAEPSYPTATAFAVPSCTATHLATAHLAATP